MFNDTLKQLKSEGYQEMKEFKLFVILGWGTAGLMEKETIELH